MDHLNQVIDLLSRSHSPFHAVSEMEIELQKHSFALLSEDKPFEIKPGGKYYVKRNGTSIIAFAIPKKPAFGFQIAATHNDSPSFKLKPHPFVPCSQGVKLSVEPYGGALFYTWLDRPLSFAGRIVVSKEGVIEERLFDLEDSSFVIPSLAIHQNRGANESLALNPAVDLLPLLGKAPNKLEDLLGQDGVEVLSHDLFLYIKEEPKIVGLAKDQLLCPRLDDLSSAYSSLFAFVSAEKEEGNIPLFASFDNEEVGSLTRQGARSDFLVNILDRILLALGANEEERIMAASKSVMLSVDNAHANHPNHPEIADPTTMVKLNGGIVIKYNANASYTTDAAASAYVKDLCKAINEPYQEFSNRSDMRGGSTLGNLSNGKISMMTADIGIAQLAMHSSVELCGTEDIEKMVDLLRKHYEK